jgi:hypothetical protein
LNFYLTFQKEFTLSGNKTYQQHLKISDLHYVYTGKPLFNFYANTNKVEISMDEMVDYLNCN